MNITVKSGEQFFITSEDSYDSAVVLSNGLLTVEAGGYVSGTVIVQSGGVLRLEEDSQVVGKLIAGGRVESEDGIVTCQHFYGFYPRLLNMTFLLDERTPEDIAIIDCLDNFQREATDRYTTTVNYSIHVTDGLAEGTYALAENAWDLESAASDSDIVCEISINGEVGDWGSPSLNVTVNGDSGVDGVFGNQYTLFIDDEGTLKLTITATGEIDQECGGKYAEILSDGAVVSRAGILLGKAVSQNGNDTLHVHSQGSAIQTTIGAGGIGMVYSRGVASETVVNGGELQVLKGGYAYETEVLGQGTMTVSGGMAYGGTVSDNGQVNLEPGILSHGDGCVFWAQGQAYDFEVASGGSFTAYDHSLAVNLTIQNGGYASGKHTDLYHYIDHHEEGYMEDYDVETEIIGAEYIKILGMHDWMEDTYPYEDLTYEEFLAMNGIEHWYEASFCNVTVHSGGVFNVAAKAFLDGTLRIGGTVISPMKQGGTREVLQDDWDELVYADTPDYSDYQVPSIIFTVEERNPADATMVNCLDGLVSCFGDVDLTYAITVDGNQQTGRYLLAENAWDLDAQVWADPDGDGLPTGVVFSLTEYAPPGHGDDTSSTIYVNGYRTIGRNTYYLDLWDDGSLSLTIEREPYKCSDGQAVELISFETVTSRADVMNKVTLPSAGNDVIHVHGGGAAYETTIGSGAFAWVTGDYITRSDGAYVWAGGTADGLEIRSGGSAEIDGRGIARQLTVSNGGTVKTGSRNERNSRYYELTSSGIAANQTDGGYGIISSAVIHSGGVLDLSHGAELQGTITIGGTVVTNLSARRYPEFDAEPYVYNEPYQDPGGYIVIALPWIEADEADIIFAVNERTTDDPVMVDNLSKLIARSYGITVNVNQTTGKYFLANGASSFTANVTVKDTASTTLGTISVGGTLNSGNRSYTLAVEDGTLSLTVSPYTPPVLNGRVETFNIDNVKTSAADVMTGKTLVRKDSADVVMRIYNGGLASANTVSSGGTMLVSNGGEARGNVVSNYGSMFVFNGGVARDNSLSAHALMYVSNGGVASANTLGSTGIMYISNGGLASANTISSQGSMRVSNGGVARENTVSAYGSMFVSSGGVASETTVSQYGGLLVYDGAYATGTIIHSQGSARVYGGVMSDTKVYGTREYLSTGGVRYSAGELHVYSNGLIDQTYASDGVVYLNSTAMANQTVLELGALMVSGGAVANYTQVKSNAQLNVFDDAVASHFTVESAARLRIVRDGGILTGRMRIDANALVYEDSSPVYSIVYNVAEEQPGDIAILNDWSKLKNATYNVVTVSASQAEGVYTLAGGAATFNKTITVKTADDSTLGTLGVDGVLTANGQTYRLGVADGTLYFTVGANSYPPFGQDAPVETFQGDNATRVSAARVMRGKTLLWATDEVYMRVRNGGVASDTVVSRLAEVNVSNGGLVVGTTVNSAGYLRVSQGGVASRTTVNSLGSLLVSHGGLAKDTSVNSDGRVWAYATVSGLTVSSGGSLTLAGGATALQGRQVYGGTVWANAETQAQDADIVFALDERTPSDEVILYQLNNLSEANSYTVSITAEQASGTYRLATGAGDFSQHVNVTIDGSLSAGGSFWLKPMITPSIPIFVYYNKITNPKHDFGYTYEYRQGHYYTFHLWTDSNDTLLLTVTNRSASDPLPNITTQSLVQLPGTYDFQATITVDNCQRPTYYIRYAKDKDEVAQATYLNGLNFSLTPSDAAKTYYYQIGVLDEYNIFHETVVNPFTVIDYTPPELTVSEVTANYQNGRFSLTWQPATDNVAVQGYEMVINGRVYQLRASALTELNYFGKPDYYYTLDSKLCASIGVANAPVSWSLVAYDAAGNRSEIASGLEGEHALPDLLIDSFSVAVNDQETTSLGLADRATVTILVKNAGQAASPATTARLYCGEVEIATIAVSALEAGESALCQGVLEPYSMSTGRHELRVVVDAQDSVVESDETNNEATLLLQVQDKAKPDLAIAFFYASDTLVQAGQNVSLMVGVENLGKASARASKLYFYAGDKLITSLSLSSLEAGAFRQISYTMPASAIKAGKTVITVVADGLDQVEESNENNNAATLVVSTDLPDLTVSRFRSLSESPTTADDIVLDFIVRNAGAVSADASEAWIYDGDKKLGQVALSALPTNTGAQGSFVIKAGELTAGTHVLTFKADGANTVAETNESNNSKQLTLTVAQKDISAPVISGVTVVQEEDSYQFTIIVNATDNLTATDQLKYKFTLAEETQDGLNQRFTRNGLSFTLEPSDAGKTFWLNVQVCDLSGNVGNYVLPFIVNDVTAPVIESFTVTAQNSNAVLAWSASDNVAVVHASIVVDGVLFKSGNLNSPQTVTGLTSGNHTIALTVRDAAGNRTTTSVDNFSLGDVTAPQFANISLEQIGADYDFYLTVFATDDLTTPDKLRYQLEYRLEGETFLQAKGLTFQLTPAAASRTLEYQVTVTDESGNTTKSGIQSMIVRDTTAPQIPVNLQAVATDDGMYLNWNPAADNVATTGYLLLVGESQDQLLGGKPIILTSAEYALSVPHSGQFFWTVAAFDAAGNISAYSDVASFLVVDRDPYEPNDSSEEAYNLKNDEAFLNRNETWESQGAFLAPGDEDWFILKLQENGTDSDGIWLEYDASLGDLELSLTSKNGTKVFGSVKAVDGRAYLPLAGQKATGNFRIRIAAAEHQEPIPYTLRITASTGQIQPDRFDTKTHNDTIQTAVPLPLSEMSLTSLTIHDAYDVDFFHFTLDQNGGKNSAISATFERSELMDMELYDGKGQLLSSTSTLQKAELSLEGLPVGDYYLKVHSLQDNVNSYSLKWNITQSQVPADRLEGLEPVTITDSVRLDDLTISPNSSDADRKDTFVITLPRQGDARSVISVHGYNPDWGNGLAYTITDEQGKVVASGVDSEIPLQGLAPGNYTLVVDTPLDGSYGDYVLEVKLPEETGYEVTSRQVLLIYACCDNNGHNQAIPELLNMQHVYANENVETYVLMDRSSDAEYQAMYKNNSENWSDTRVARLRYSSSTVLDQEWLSWGECDTGNLSTLQRFLDWAHTEVAGPAQYTLVLKDHGSGLGFCCQDEESGNILSIDGIADLLKNYDDIPVVVMDSCLMGSDLVVTTMSGVSDYLVASEAISYWYGAVLDFGEMYYNLTSDMTPGQIADLFVSTQYTTTYRDHGLTSFKTSDDSLAQALNRFGEASAKFTDADWKALVSAFAQARDYVGGGTYGTSDFGLLLNSLTSPSPALSAAIAEFQETYKNDVLSLCVSYPGTYGTGLAVINPLKTQAYRLNYYTRGYKMTIPAWADFLQGIYDRGASASIDIASIKSLGIVPDFEDEALCLGLFCGAGLQISNIAFNGDKYFQLDISTLPDGKGNITVDALSTVGNQPGAVSLTLYDEDFQAVLTGMGQLDLSSLGPMGISHFYLQATAAEADRLSIGFTADWTNGIDRFDYEVTKSDRSDFNGNGSLELATQLGLETVEGLLTYNGDSDWYRLATENTDRCQVTLAGSGLTVQLYDAGGNYLQDVNCFDGEYNFIADGGSYLRVEGTADLASGHPDAYMLTLQATVKPAENGVVITDSLDTGRDWNGWDGNPGEGYFTVQYSQDDFETCLSLRLTESMLSLVNLPGEGWKWRVRTADGDWLVSDVSLDGSADSETDPASRTARMDGAPDLFFATANFGTWQGQFLARHQGAVDEWNGTGETAALKGKNILSDIFQGARDANILFLTDDANGDALFTDDIYGDSYQNLGKQQSRLADIQQVFAGAGDDIIDMTSSRFAYIGKGVTIHGGDGNDVLWANSGSNSLYGDAGDDRLVGGRGDDVLAGGSGNDSLCGGGGQDIFAFASSNWGHDTVSQVGDGDFRLWFADGLSLADLELSQDKGNVLVSRRGSDDCITVTDATVADLDGKLLFGDNAWNGFHYADMQELGVFSDLTSTSVFNDPLDKYITVIARS